MSYRTECYLSCTSLSLLLWCALALIVQHG